MSAPIYIFAGGGTGGHLFPALAVAERLADLRPEARIVFACSQRELDRRILARAPYPFVPQPIRPMPRALRGWGGFLKGWWESLRTARDMVGDLAPAAVLGLGGFAAVPVVRAAARAGVRTAMTSIDAVPGVANRHLARHVQTIFAQFPATRWRYGRKGRKVQVVGCPVRRGLLSGDAAEARRTFGLREDRKTLLVMSGSLGADNVNDAVAALGADLDALAEQWQVLHLAGAGKLPPPSPPAGIHRLVLEFCERMDLAYAVADLALCRAGASTIGELSAVGVPGVLMPYPHHRDRQQRHNAAEMASGGAAVVIDDVCDAAANAEALRGSLIEIMRRPDRLAAMRQAACPRRRPDAAEAVARWLAG